MNILEACFSGLVMSCSAMDNDRAVDVVLVGEKSILVLFADWWVADWGTDGYAYLEGTLAQDGDTWRLKRTDSILVYFAAPEMDALALDARNNRAQQRFSKASWGQYLDKLKIADVSDGFETAVASWIALAAPKEEDAEPVEAEIIRVTANRPVGILPLLCADGVVVDALMIDGHGAAATLAQDPWLLSIASQWSSYESDLRPSITEFLAWAGSKTPMGSRVLGKPRESNAEGTVEAIALRYVPTTL